VEGEEGGNWAVEMRGGMGWARPLGC